MSILISSQCIFEKIIQNYHSFGRAAQLKKLNVYCALLLIMVLTPKMRNLTGNINTATATLCPLLLYNIQYTLKNNQYVQ